MPAVSGSPTQLASTVLTLTDLGGLPDDAFKDGDLAWAIDVGRHYVLRRQAEPFAENGTTLISAYSGNGYWEIMGSLGELWGSVADWYIDAVAGDDSNYGNTSSAPLATFAELARRWVGVPANPQAGHSGVWATVHVLSGTPNSDVPTFVGLPPGSVIYVQGDSDAATVVVASVALTGVAADNPAGNVYPTITAAALVADWTSYLGKTLRIKTANGGDQARVGALGQVVADLGAKQARIINFRSLTTRLEYNASVGDVLEIIDLPIIACEPCVIADNASVQVYFDGLGFELDFNYDTNKGCNGYATFTGCNIRGGVLGGVFNVKGGITNFINTLFYSPDAQVAELDVWAYASFYAFNSGFGVDNTFGSNAFIIDYGIAFTFFRKTLFQSGANAFIGPGSNVLIQSIAVFSSTYRTFTFYAGVNCNLSYSPAYVYGTGNAWPIFCIGPNVRISYLNTTQFVSTDTGGPNAPPIYFVGYAQQTWANLAAGPGIAKTAAAADTQSTFTLTTLV